MAWVKKSKYQIQSRGDYNNNVQKHYTAQTIGIFLQKGKVLHISALGIRLFTLLLTLCLLNTSIWFCFPLLRNELISRGLIAHINL